MKIISAEDQNALHLQKEREAFTLARFELQKAKPSEALDLLKPIGKRMPRRMDASAVRWKRSVLEALAYHADANLSEATQLIE